MSSIVGQRFGRLVVLSQEGANPAYCHCVCDCGGTARPRRGALITGATRSCGCLHRETARGNSKAAAVKNTRHGKSYSRLYRIWLGMKQRCLHPENVQFSNYGGRGITICSRWMDFPNFLADVGEPPEGMTLDRIDNDRGYEPGNVRWATMSQQHNNRRNNLRLTFKGETHTLAEWAQITGINPQTLLSRLALGWPIEAVLTRPVQTHRRRAA